MEQKANMTNAIRSGARIQIGNQMYEFLGMVFQHGEARFLFQERGKGPQTFSADWLSIHYPEIIIKEPSRQAIELPCPDGFTLCATTGGDCEDYPEIYTYARSKDGVETDLCAAGYLKNSKPSGRHAVFLYENPETDEYTRRVEVCAYTDSE